MVNRRFNMRLAMAVILGMVWGSGLLLASSAEGTRERDRAMTREYLRELGDTFQNSVGMRFVYLSTGTFIMGAPADEPGSQRDERPAREVRIENGFFMGVHEVTQAQWEAVMGYNNSFFKGADLPVEKVAWLEVQKFLEKLNQLEKTDRYALPTEAEWEFACRAGSNTPYSWGTSPDPACAWYRDSAGSQTHPVGSLAPNAWGLYDMAGNVSEWVADIYAPYPGSEMEPPPADDRPTPVTRGGSWASNGEDLRSGNRSRLWDHYRLSLTGFRIKARF